eukprot:scaffold916_cov129-Skeletonema_menzelii.AAC.3
MSFEIKKNKKAAVDLRMPLSEWIRPRLFQTSFGNQQQQQQQLLSVESAATALPDDNYLIPALQIACSLADQICRAKEESGQSPAPGSDWIDSIVVITEGAPSSDADIDGDAYNNVRAEILPSLSNTRDDSNSGRERNCGTLFSLGVVFYEIFSRGERPAELERKQTSERDRTDGSQDQLGTEGLLENLDPLPFDQGEGMIDLEGVDIDDLEAIKFDDLQDQYNDIWGINVTDGSLQGQNPRKKTSTSNNFVMCAVSIEPLKARGVPGPLCDLIANMLDAADAVGNARLGREDVYRDVSDVRDDLQLMLEKPSIYLYDQDMRRLSTTGLQFGGT